MHSNPKNILIFKKGALGDIIASTCAIMLLKQNFPDCKITILSSGYCLHICPPGTIVDYFIDYFRWIEKPNGFLKLAAELRKCKFDLAINFREGSESDDLLMLLSGAQITVGSNGSFLSNFLTFKISKNTKRRHEYLKQIDRLKPLGILSTTPQPYIHITQSQQTAADNFYSTNGLTKAKTLVIAPTASHLSKAWPANRFVEICKRFIQLYNSNVVVTWDPSQEKLGKKVAEEIGDGAYITPLLDIGTLAAIISNGALCLCNNSGSMNIAVAVKTPTLALSTTPAADWGAFGKGNITIYPYEYETDEAKHDWAQRASHVERLEIQRLITVNEVWDKLSMQWNEIHVKPI